MDFPEPMRLAASAVRLEKPSNKTMVIERKRLFMTISYGK
jgi:hypothetical protein